MIRLAFLLQAFSLYSKSSPIRHIFGFPQLSKRKIVKMAYKRPLLFYFAVALVILSTLTQEAEARRKILRGRRVMTRTYYRGTAVPAWAISLLSGIGMLLVGGVLYVVMRKLVLSSETGSLNTYQPAAMNEV